MKSAVKVCRVCGKEYKGCKNANQSGTFRWQDVACSPECGAEYLKRIKESRGVKAVTQKVTAVEEPKNTVIEMVQPVRVPEEVPVAEFKTAVVFEEAVKEVETEKKSSAVKHKKSNKKKSSSKSHKKATNKSDKTKHD